MNWLFSEVARTILGPVRANLIASSGQKWAQTPQPIQRASLMTATVSTNSGASTGHFSTQMPHPTHFSSFTLDIYDVRDFNGAIP